MVLAHNDGLACVDGVVLDSLQPDVLIEHLRNSVPEIRQVQCVNEGAEVAMTKIATLSKGPFTTTAVTNENPMRIGEIRSPTASDVPKQSTVDGMKDMSKHAPRANSVGNSADLYDVEDDDYLVWTFPEAAPTAKRDRTLDSGEAEGNTDNPLDGYDGPRWICHEHGTMCIPGICKASAGPESTRSREKEHQERQQAEKRGKWKEAEKRERKLATGESREVSHGLPLHPASYPSRGAGSSSESKDDTAQDSGVGFQHGGSSAVGRSPSGHRLDGEPVPEPRHWNSWNASADDENEWVDEDVGIESVTDDLLQLEFHTDYVGNPDKRLRRWKLRWEALLRSFHALDRETDTTLVLLAAPSHTGKLHSVASRAIRRDVELLNSPDMTTARSAFAKVAARRRASHSASLLEQLSRVSSSPRDGSGGSEARKEDLRRALDTTIGSLGALGSLYEQREMRWIEEKRRLDEDKEKVQLLLKQVLGVGVVGNLVETAI